MSEEKNMKGEDFEPRAAGDEQHQEDMGAFQKESDTNQPPPAVAEGLPQAQQHEPEHQPQPINMEVHKHPHHVMHRKKWPEYLLEFLMLFLAVYLGFLAENIREHNVEKKKGDQYVYSFSEDLKKDTVQCDLSIAELTESNEVLKNLPDCFNELERNIHATDCLKRIIFYSTGFTDFIYTDRTIQQLKNAGGLRLIEDKEIADSIIDYDATVRAMHIHQSVLENLQQISRNAHNSMIDFIHLDKIERPDEPGDLFLLSPNEADLNRYFNAVNDFRVGLRAQLRWMYTIRNKATKLLQLLIRKGYR